MKYLLDTNILSEPLKPAPNQAVLDALQQYQLLLVTAAPIWHELWFGCERLENSTRKKQIHAYLTEVIRPSMEILPYDEEASLWHGQERGRLAKLGRSAPFVDGQIAAIAATNGLTLISRNAADFKQFNDINVENWFR